MNNMLKTAGVILLVLFSLRCRPQDPLILRSSDTAFAFNASEPTLIITSPGLRKPLMLNAYHQAPGFKRTSMTWSQDALLPSRTTVFIDARQHTLICTETFAPTPGGLSWQVKWSTPETDPFTAPLQTICRLASNDETVRFWTTWGDPSQVEPVDHAIQSCKQWVDPLQLQPLRDLHLVYGGHKSLGGGFCLPAFTVLYPQQNAAWSLVQSPQDTLLNMDLKTSAQGWFEFNRTDLRLSRSRSVRHTLSLIVHEADWRAALSWIVTRYPDYFNPPNPNAGRVAGCGLYSSYEGEFDVKKFHRMGGLVNWKASFDFPYMGMFIPPVQDPNRKWRRFSMDAKQPATYTTIHQMARYAASMKEKGFYTLNYFNVTEFGAGIKYPPPTSPMAGQELWQDANAFLYTRLNSGILYGAQQNGGRGWDNRTAALQMHPVAGIHDTPHFTWGDAVAMDCGDSTYADFLINQCRLHLNYFPDAHGICIDRMDWLGEYNSRRDDGVSWVGDRPVASLYFSWIQLLDRIGPMWHGANKVIFSNPHVNRLELMRQIDGVYNEFGHIGFNLNMSAFLCLRKTLLAWTSSVEDLKGDADAYLQHHLYMGAFPTAPFPGNDHTIEPDPWAEGYYLDYGPLFRLLVNKKWVLTPHVIRVKDQTAKANLFETDAGYIIPVIHGTESTAEIHLKNIDLDKMISCYVIYPGGRTAPAFADRDGSQGWKISIPLERRCAMVVIGTRNN
ncbi:hypothetical protein GX408_11625 [bacterium]|nr:hypothetical protein [bacterium]